MITRRRKSKRRTGGGSQSGAQAGRRALEGRGKWDGAGRFGTCARARMGSVCQHNRRPVFLIGSFEDRTINRSARSKVARRSERFLRRLLEGAEDCRLRSRGHEGNCLGNCRQWQRSDWRVRKDGVGVWNQWQRSDWRVRKDGVGVWNHDACRGLHRGRSSKTVGPGTGLFALFRSAMVRKWSAFDGLVRTSATIID